METRLQQEEATLKAGMQARLKAEEEEARIKVLAEATRLSEIHEAQVQPVTNPNPNPSPPPSFGSCSTWPHLCSG